MNRCSQKVNISYKKYDKYFQFTTSSHFFTGSVKMANVKIALSYLLGQVECKTEKQELNTE